ncbi:MAG: ferritin-like domain-containing protein [Brevinema sp.]
MMKHLQNEVLEEMNAVKNFIEMAIVCHKAGFTKAADFFLSQAEEDCRHAFKYARELDKFDAVKPADFKAALAAIRHYQEMENAAADRLLAIREEMHQEKEFRLTPFVLEMLKDHTEEAYTAKKLLQKAEVFERTEDLAALEDEFEALKNASSDED